MERGYTAVAFIGQHARANVTGGVMAHSYSSLGIQTMLMNGEPVGEIETRTALAGHYGVPVIMLSGDKAAADDLRAIVPNAEFAVVKEGIGYYPCLSLSAKAAQELIRDKAQRALRRLSEIKPYKLPGPVTLEIEYTTRNTPLPTRTLPPGAERVGARTIRFTGRDILEVWSRYRM
jgi:D-amino peptidase